MEVRIKGIILSDAIPRLSLLPGDHDHCADNVNGLPCVWYLAPQAVVISVLRCNANAGK